MGEKRGVRSEKRRRKRGGDEREGQRAKMRQAEQVGSRGQPGTARGHPGRAVERVDWRVWMSGGSQSAGLITCWLQQASDNHNGLCRALRSLGTLSSTEGALYRLCYVNCTVATATRAKINERKRKGPGFKSQMVQSFLSEEKNAKNRENIL